MTNFGRESAESSQLNELILRIEQLSLDVAKLDTVQLVEGSQRLSFFRAESSSTTRKQGHELWLAANLYVTEKVKLGLVPIWEDILNINKILDPINKGKVRDCDIYIGGHQACSVIELNSALPTFEHEILLNFENQHPLLWATKVRYTLVTLHPFIDANGRTSNLLCDWILALNGFLPISHSSKLDSFIAGWDNRAHFSDLNFAALKTLAAVEHSYQIILQDDLAPNSDSIC